jgi:hypothetical protein
LSVRSGTRQGDGETGERGSRLLDANERFKNTPNSDSLKTNDGAQLYSIEINDVMFYPRTVYPEACRATRRDCAWRPAGYRNAQADQANRRSNRNKTSFTNVGNFIKSNAGRISNRSTNGELAAQNTARSHRPASSLMDGKSSPITSQPPLFTSC